MKAADIPSECIEEPRFIKVLAASLCSEIAESKVVLNETNEQIQQSKEAFFKAWEKRKSQKQLIQELSQQKSVLSVALESLSRETKNRSIEIETAKNRLDEATLRQVEKRAGFQKIIQNYRDTWQRYKLEYENLPLAVQRQQCCVEAKKLTVRLMTIEYKKKELEDMLRQREKIYATRIRAALVDFSAEVLQRWKDDEYLENLKSRAKEIEKQLNTYTRQLSEVQQELERKRLAESEDAAKMPPPRLHFPFMWSMISPSTEQATTPGHQRSRIHAKTPDPNNLQYDMEDTTSVNTLMLEEMCAEDDYEMKVEASGGSGELEIVRESLRPNFSPIAAQRPDSFFPPREDGRVEREQSNPPSLERSTQLIRDKLHRLEVDKAKGARGSEDFAVARDPVAEKSGRDDELRGEEANRERRDVVAVRGDSPARRRERAETASPRDAERHERPRKSAEPVNEQPDKAGSRDRNDEALNAETSADPREDRLRRGARLGEEESRDARRGQSPNPPRVSETPSLPTRHQTADHQPETTTNRRRVLATSTEPRRNDSLPLPIDPDDETTRGTAPKLRRIDPSNFPAAFSTPAPERPFKSNSKLRSNLSTSFYVPSSCVSSDNLSNFADERWAETTRGRLSGPKRDPGRMEYFEPASETFAEGNGETTEFAPFPNWDNWSPPQRTSENSFPSYVGKRKSAGDPEKRGDPDAPRNSGAEQANADPQINAFFKSTSQHTRATFL